MPESATEWESCSNDANSDTSGELKPIGTNHRHNPPESSNPDESHRNDEPSEVSTTRVRAQSIRGNVENQSRSTSLSSARYVPYTRRKRNREAANTASEALMDYLIRTDPEPQTQHQLHPVDAFLAGVAPVLKRLNELKMHKARSEIFAVVQKYELEMLLSEEAAHLYAPAPVQQNQSQMNQSSFPQPSCSNSNVQVFHLVSETASPPLFSSQRMAAEPSLLTRFDQLPYHPDGEVQHNSSFAIPNQPALEPTRFVAVQQSSTQPEQCTRNEQELRNAKASTRFQQPVIQKKVIITSTPQTMPRSND